MMMTQPNVKQLRQRYTPTITNSGSTRSNYTTASASAMGGTYTNSMRTSAHGSTFSRKKAPPPASSVTPLLPPMGSEGSVQDSNEPMGWTSFGDGKNKSRSNPFRAALAEKSSSFLDRKKSASPTTQQGTTTKVAVATAVLPTFCELPSQKDDDPVKHNDKPGGTQTAIVALDLPKPKSEEPTSASGSSSSRRDQNQSPQQRPALATTSVRAKIEERLQKALQEASLTRHRSPELVPLSAEYEELQKNLRIMVTAVTNYADSTQRMNRARDAMAHQLGVLSRNSPLYGQLGRPTATTEESPPKENEPQTVLALPTHLSEEERRKFVEGELIVGEVATAEVVATTTAGRPPTIWEGTEEEHEEEEEAGGKPHGKGSRGGTEKRRFFGGPSAASAANSAGTTTTMGMKGGLRHGSHPLSPSSLLTRLATPPKSLAEVQTMASVRAAENQSELDQHVVRWVLEWRDTVTEWVDRKKKEVRKLQKDKDHYESKVEHLRRRCHSHSHEIESCSSRNATTNAVVGSGASHQHHRTASPAQLEKLERNERKLKEAFLRFETEAARLCALLEAVTRDGWIELYNLSRNYMKWESNRVKREADVYSHLGVTLELLKITQKRSLLAALPPPPSQGSSHSRQGSSWNRRRGSSSKTGLARASPY